ncbi:MAG: hypothetical protein AAF806_15295, partial [Bacteroidota bacterium]
SEKGNELTALRYDSVFYNVHLGITYQQFLENCWKNHQQQFFYPNEKGTAVTFELTEGFSSSVIVEFFPKVIRRDLPIKKFTGHIRYKNYSQYNRQLVIDNLIKEILRFFEEGYGGNKFLEIPNENKILSSSFCKLDGNRKIELRPTFTGDRIELTVEDIE